MNLVYLPLILKRILPDIVWDIHSKKQVLYLTFDDGPTPVITNQALEILAHFNARATFFCIGRNVERHPEIYRQVIDNGHATGNHTYSHLKGWYTKNREYFNDIALAAQFIPSGLFRPAYGMITPSQIRKLKQQYRIVLWSIMSYDFHKDTSPDQCLNNLIQHVRPGSVVVFHDSVKASTNMLHALPRVLEYFGQRGFEFRAIPPQ
jgi:peptidoglycan/xylan/chitin deacetylase (PgdA/CDA1 family)